MKKILLFSDIPPSNNYSGGLVLKQLCEFLPSMDICGIIVMNPSLNPEIPINLNSLDLNFYEKPRDNWGKGIKNKFFSEIISFFMESINSMFFEPKIIKNVIKKAKEFKAEALWMVVEGHSLIRMENKIRKKTDIPIHCLIWDPPGWWLRENKVNKITKYYTIKRFEKLLQTSAKIGTASIAMKKEYEKIGANAIPLISSIPSSSSYLPAEKPHNRNEFIITIAGQIYALTEWESLMLALEKMNWTINGKIIKVRVLSRYVSLWTNGKTNIEFLGWRSQEDTISILQDSDILFCPYWFREDFETEAKLSYPSKLTSYFASGRPVFFLGPTYSSPAKLIEDHKIGLGCYTLNTQDIINSISILANDEKMYGTITKNASNFFKENLTNQVLQNNFYEFLNID